MRSSAKSDPCRSFPDSSKGIPVVRDPQRQPPAAGFFSFNEPSSHVFSRSYLEEGKDVQALCGNDLLADYAHLPDVRLPAVSAENGFRVKCRTTAFTVVAVMQSQANPN